MKNRHQKLLATTFCVSLLGAQSVAFAAYQIQAGKISEAVTCTLPEAISMVNNQSFTSSANCSAEYIEGEIDNIVLVDEEYDLESTINISHSVRIVGQSPTATLINGMSKFLAFNINDQTSALISVHFDNLSIVSAGKEGWGSRTQVGAIKSTENVSLDNVHISDSYGKLASAVLVDGAALIVTNSVISNNSGPASVITSMNNSSTRISNTRVIDNEFKGSALQLVAVSGFELNESEFSNNTGSGNSLKGTVGVLEASIGTIANSTITKNSTSGDASAGVFASASNLDITHSTIVNNSDEYSADNAFSSGIQAENGANIVLNNSLLAGNGFTGFSNLEEIDCLADESSQVTSNQHNIVQNPGGCSDLATDMTVESFEELNLLALSSQGGNTQSMVPLADSPALNNASGTHCLPMDQRGLQRPADSQCDIGAVEMQGAPVAQNIDASVKSVGREKVDILSYVVRRESDIDKSTLVVTPNFYSAEDDPDNSEGTYKLDRNMTLIFTKGSGFGGSVTFTYSIKDIHGRESNEGEILIANTDPVAPIAVDDTYHTEGEDSIRFDVTDNDIRGSSNYDRGSMVVESRPKHGRLSYLVLSGAGGVFIYTPDTGFGGTDSFTYSIATREGLRSNTATVSISTPTVKNDDDDELGSLNLFMLLGLLGLIVTRRVSIK